MRVEPADEDQEQDGVEAFRGWLPTSDDHGIEDEDTGRVTLESLRSFIRSVLEGPVIHRSTSPGKKYIGRVFKGRDPRDRERIVQRSMDTSFNSPWDDEEQLAKNLGKRQELINPETRKELIRKKKEKDFALDKQRQAARSTPEVTSGVIMDFDDLPDGDVDPGSGEDSLGRAVQGELKNLEAKDWALVLVGGKHAYLLVDLRGLGYRMRYAFFELKNVGGWATAGDHQHVPEEIKSVLFKGYLNPVQESGSLTNEKRKKKRRKKKKCSTLHGTCPGYWYAGGISTTPMIGDGGSNGGGE